MRTDENDEDKTEDDDDAWASASSTPWPDDAFTDMSAPERYITLASPTTIAAALSEVRRQEEAELAEANEEVYSPSSGTFRRKSNLDSPGWRPYNLGTSEFGVVAYQLFATRRTGIDASSRIVWRYIGRIEGEERKSEPKLITTSMLENVG
jgi:hypothetical protein